VVTGCVGRYMRLKKLEELLRGASIESIESDRIAQVSNVRFAGKKAMSPEYLKHLVVVQIERGLAAFSKR